MTLSRPLAALSLAALLGLAACDDGASEPPPLPTGTPGERLLGRWQVPEPTLPPTIIELARAAEGTRARVALSGVTYDGTATGDENRVVVYEGTAPRIRGELVDDRMLRIQFLGEGGLGGLTQVLVRTP